MRFSLKTLISVHSTQVISLFIILIITAKNYEYVVISEGVVAAITNSSFFVFGSILIP